MKSSSMKKKLKTSNLIPLSSLQTNQHELPDDVIFISILPRLSYKSLSKFKCVSKRWYELICNDAKFAEEQSVCPSPLSCGTIYSHWDGNKLHIFNTFDSPIGFDRCHHLLFEDPYVRFRRILASSCGLLCILFCYRESNFTTINLYVGNLATGVGEVIPCEPIRNFSVGLAFDPSIEPNCYQLIYPLWHGYINPKDKVAYGFDVYSTKTCKWVRSDQTINKDIIIKTSSSFSYGGKPLTVKNIVYWDYHEYMISFDPWKNVAGYIELPKKHGETFRYVQELGTCNGHITCTRMDSRSMLVYLFDERENIWEMRYKVDLDRLIIDSNPDLFMEFWHTMEKRSGGSFEELFPQFCPFPYEGGNVLFFRVGNKNDELVFSYDLKAKMVTKFCEFKVIGSWERSKHKVFSYHNSMVKVPQLCQPSLLK